MSIGHIPFPIHLVTDVLSFYIGYIYYKRLRAKSGDHLNDDRRYLIIVAAACGALIGSRLLGALEDLGQFLHPASLIYYYANKTIIGGLIGGILGVEIVKKFLGQKSSTGDLFALPLIVGIFIGRIGCFLTGVSDGTVGLPSNLPWAMDQGDGIPRHPLSLYELIFLASAFLAISLLSKSKKIKLANGSLFRIFIVSYLLFRFFIESIKPVEHAVWGLSIIQIVCIAFALYYLTTIPFLKRRGA